MKRLASFLMAAAAFGCATGPTASSDDSLLVIRGGRVLAGEALAPIDDGAIVIRDGRIAWVGPAAALPDWAQGAEV
ncbi:MAG: imidazolonepropionase-like domain-containing protein, partial [Thermoanaerobaculia bacterium]